MVIVHNIIVDLTLFLVISTYDGRIIMHNNKRTVYGSILFKFIWHLICIHQCLYTHNKK